MAVVASKQMAFISETFTSRIEQRKSTMKNILAFVLLGACVIGCEPEKKEDITPPTASTTTIEAPSEPSIGDRLATINSVSEAWNACLPFMKDKGIDDDINEGSICFAEWGTHHFLWNMVSVSQDETTPGLIKKNPDMERGKRMCATGTIIQIRQEGSLSTGLLQSYAGYLYNFTNVGSSGSLVERNEARLCGFVVGTYSYRNSGGGVGHAVDLVGMWDLNHVAQ
jgi:hypothetical protein